MLIRVWGRSKQVGQPSGAAGAASDLPHSWGRSALEADQHLAQIEAGHLLHLVVSGADLQHHLLSSAKLAVQLWLVGHKQPVAPSSSLKADLSTPPFISANT